MKNHTMHAARWLLALTVLLLLAGSFTGCSNPGPEIDLAITDVSVVDVATGKIHPHQTILIHAGRILDVQAAPLLENRRAGRRIDGSGLHAIPGLWDMHVHVLWDAAVAEAWLPEFSRYGITGIRDMGGDLAVLQQVRDAPPTTTREWPRVMAAGQILDGPEPVDPSISIPVTDAREARAAVETLARHGVDFIKVYTLLPDEAYHAALARARELDLPVAGHVPAGVSIAEAVAAGQASIEHLRDEIEPFCTGLEQAACQALIVSFGASGVHNTPTLTVIEAKSYPDYRPPGTPRPEQDLPEVVRSYWEASARSHAERPADHFAARSALFTRQVEFVGRLSAEDAPLLAGSDTGNPFIYPGAGLHRELELLVSAGLSPRQALHAATLGPARFLGIADTTGTLQPGATADIVLVKGNPLEDISSVRHIGSVILRGQVLPHTEESRP